jgi:MoaA/NifB/PqqE/SkfB family radical SAM enzyme
MEFAAQQVRCVRLVTNGALLYRPTVAEAIARAGDQAQVSVRVSLNAGTSQTHDRLHGVRGFFPRIVQGMKQLSQLNPQVELGASFLVEEANAAELQQAFQIAEEVGAQ